ncbi:hypothetical protein [Gracilibacillus massiliensis]|uniref:hypothetical protein n=1 Tax=Gracilibacillus massiliensis TaxID=1564956 RepID=UPI00071E472A|nr:hypothetical protein [Gracilibacillus massiliensis]
MKKLIGVTLLSILLLVLGANLYANDGSNTSNMEEYSPENVKLIETQVDDKTGQVVEVYKVIEE